MIRWGKSRRSGGRRSGLTIAYTGLSAATLTRTSGPTTYPVTADFTRPSDWADVPTMYAVMQISADPTFATGVTESAPLQITAAVLTYNFGLSAIVTPQIRYFRLGAYTGVRPAVLLWSNIQGVGDAVAPTITSSAAPTGYQFIAGSLTLTADKAATWAIVGGADMAQFTRASNVLSYPAQAASGTLTVQVQATSYFGVPSTVQTIGLVLAANTPTAFVFTDVANATFSTVYTSNTITIAGIVGGVSVPVSVTVGTYSKNGGAYVSTATTAVNGDTFALRGTSGAANNLSTDVAFTAGVTTDTYNIATPVVASQWDPATVSATPYITFSNGNRTATMTNVGGPVNFKGTTVNSSGKKWIEIVVFQAAGSTATPGIIDIGSGTTIKWDGGGGSNTGTNWNVGWAGATVVNLMFVVDFTALTIAGYKDGTFINTIPLPGTAVNLRPWGELAYAINPYLIINTGQATPMGGVPSGSTAWG